MSKKKRLVAIGDFHCGHVTGLTPPGWDGEKQREWYPEHYASRRAVWEFYANTVKYLQPIDILLVNGDLIDGRQEIQGGAELLETDRLAQVEMAIDCIQAANPKQVVLTFGTAYHTGRYEDFEKIVYLRLPNASKIGGEDSYNINGWIVNARHHVGRGSLPHTRYTALAKEQLANMMWAAREEYALADVILRSHVHYFAYCGGSDPEPWLACTLPALQGYGGRYGTRRMTGTVDIGIVSFDFPKKGKGVYTWTPYLHRFAFKEPVQL